MNLTVLQPTTTVPAVPSSTVPSPHPSTFFPEFKQCKTKGDLLQIHAKLIKTGRIRDPLASAELIRFSALSDPPHRDLQYALHVFQQMNPPNCFTYNTLIRAFCDSNDPLQSFILFAQMIENSDEVVKPNKFTFPSVLKACAKLGGLEEGRQTHCVLVKYGLEKDGFVVSNLVRMYVMCGEIKDGLVVFESGKMDSSIGEVVLWNVMVDGYVKIGELGNARKLFDEMPQRSVVSWNSMISGYAQNGFFVEAVELFREMQVAVMPNYVTLISVLPAISGLGALEIGKWVHFFAGKNGIKVDPVLGSALIDMYSKCGGIDEAVQLFNTLSQKNVVTWNSIINGLAIHGRANEALHYFTKMEESGVRPNDVTYISVLMACSHAGLVDKGLSIFNEMVRTEGLAPRLEHYGCMVDLLGRAGRLQEAEKLILDMPEEPDDVVLKALLGACKKHGNIQIGERVGKRLLEKNPEDGAPYVALSNMYASLANWDKVMQTRLMMKENEVKKDPGCSWIEVDGAIHEFVVADESHAKANDIYMMLEEMKDKLRVAGYKPDTTQVFLRMDDPDKESVLHHHSEKIAVAFGLISTTRETTIKVVKNLRICDDCHSTIKLVSRIYGRRIVVRDRKRFHHFENGSCSSISTFKFIILSLTSFMGFQTRPHSSLILPILFLYLSFATKVLTYAPRYACDTDVNPSLKKYAFCDTSRDIKTRVGDLVKRMTLQEKAGSIVSVADSIPRLGIPSYGWWSEALHGVSDTGPATWFNKSVIPGATSFPQVILTAASFNESLFYTIGKVVSTEARAMYNSGVAGLTFWSPNVNIFRDPRWGRGQETPGEDPVLTSRYGVAYVKGLQEREDGDKERLKIGACCKHYTAYDLDNWTSVDRYHFDAFVTKQDLEDTYNPPFKSCVLDGKVASVMCSYNKVNGVPTCGDRKLLEDMVRGEWKLNGYISSDCDSLQVMFRDQRWAKTPEEVAADALNAGLDLNCGDSLKRFTATAVKKGLVKQSVVDRAVTNSFTTLMRLGFFDGHPRKQLYGNLGKKDVCTPAHQDLAREAARQGIVLLKNTFRSLPLHKTSIKSLAVIGPNANATRTMIGNYAGVPCKYTSPLKGLSDYVKTVYEEGCDVKCNSAARFQKARDIAAKADAVVLVMGTDLSIEAEALDRTEIYLPGQQDLLVSEVAKDAKGPVILVIMSGGGMDVEFAKGHPKITSILWVGFPGQEGGRALADIVFGRYNPSGRLPTTWYPRSYVNLVPMTNTKMRPDPKTGQPGQTYRFHRGKTVYPFGFGLSYSSYNYKLIKAPKFISIPSNHHAHTGRSPSCHAIDAADSVCNNLHFDIEIMVTNVGKMSGSHTVLLFSSPPMVHNAPQKELVDFKKVWLGRSKRGVVRFRVDVCKGLSVVDEEGKRKVVPGRYVLQVGYIKHVVSVTV
ncbi:hypothetical protein SSX86_006535 [Deinandra increscens subsp. villosa]|uniref:Fibronectin type III-like domain-containing protein n=1 Tax=Deinandra increscens subsp. villosa TaxID=3103831 RepID=A0AAP0DG83_9ASTR